MEYLLDTNILLHLLRNDTIGKYVEEQLQVLDAPNIAIISVVTLAEIRSIAMQRAWGKSKVEVLEDLLSSFVIADIHAETVIEKYVEIDAFSQGKHPTIVLQVSARNMGKNDVWIAATAAALNVTLLTTDRDFSHLKDVFLKMEIL
jgi:predicted nucleic acid-binding protein